MENEPTSNPKPESGVDVAPLLGKIHVLMDRAIKEVGAGVLMDRIYDFAGHLRDKYPDYFQRRAYHGLIGSTMSPSMGEPIEEDFPGEDSVINFFESLL